MKILVTGWKHSKGEYNGNPYNYVTVYCQTKMEQKDNQRGSAGIDMRGEPQLVEKLNKINFTHTVECELELETRATGKGQFVETVVSVSPVIPSKI